MTTTVQAIYEENDILRLLAPLGLEKGAHVEVTVNSTTLAELERTAPDPRPSAEMSDAEVQARLEIVQSITACAVSHGRLETASRDHDKFLYGPEDAR